MSRRGFPSIVGFVVTAVLLLAACGYGSDARIRIATFNIQNFGPTKANNPDILATLAGIVRKYDVVAVQEVSDVSGKAPRRLLDAINANGAKYKLLLSARTGRQADDKPSQEQYAFYFNSASIRANGRGALFPDQHDKFQREPYVAGFTAGNFAFVLITVHTRPEQAVAEIGALADVFAWAQTKYQAKENFIALGDFNAGCSYANASGLNGLHATLPFLWIVPDTSDSNLAPGSACPYDRIVMIDGGGPNYDGQWAVDHAFTDSHVSDHWPVWAEFSIVVP